MRGMIIAVSRVTTPSSSPGAGGFHGAAATAGFSGFGGGVVPQVTPETVRSRATATRESACGRNGMEIFMLAMIPWGLCLFAGRGERCGPVCV